MDKRAGTGNKGRKGIIQCGILIPALLLCLLLTGCSAKGLSGRDWINKQYSDLMALKEYCKGMDDVVSLYVEELALLKAQFIILQDDCKSREEELLPGKVSEEEIKAIRAYQKTWADVRELILLITSDKSILDGNQLIYQYLAYKEIIREDVSEYLDLYYKYNPGAETEE